MAAPVFDQLGTSTAFAAASSVNVPLPATVADNAVAFMIVGASDRAGSETFTWPAGWTELSQQLQGVAFHYAGAAWKRLAASDGGTSPTVSFSSALSGSARVITFTGAKSTGTPFEQYAANAGTSGSSTSTAMTTTEGNELGVILHCYGRNSISSPPAGWTERMDSGANLVRTCVDSKTLAAPGTEAATSRTIASDDWITWTFALLSEPISATLASSSGALSSSLAATVEHSATLSSSSSSLSAGLAATVEHPATLSSSIAALAPAAAFTVEHPATLSSSSGALSSSLAATVAHSATLAAVLPKVDGQLAGTITTPDKAQLDAVLGPLSAGLAATVEHSATLSANLGALDAAAIANVSGPAAGLEATIGALSAVAAFTVTPHAYKLERLAGPFTRVLDVNPRRNRLQVGDCALVRIEVRDGNGAVDLATAPLLQFVFRRPDGSGFVRTASRGATLGRLEYRLAPADLDRAGDWSVQARVVRAGGGELRTPPREFFVGWNLPTA